MKPHLAHHPRERGVALVTTVIVVAVLAVVAVAFMQSTTTDRLSSRSVANYTRAKLAAEAGLAVAEATLARAMTNDTFIVVANTNRQLFVGNGVSNSTDFSYTPAFSTSPNLTSAVAPIVTGGIPTTNVAGGILFTNAMPGGLSITSPAVSWVYLTDASGQTNARFAYWVEDLGGKLDLSVVGATNASDRTNARRLTGTNPAEIALWSLFNTNSASDPGNAVSTKIAAARSNIPTPATARLVDPLVTSNMMADLASGLVHDTNEPILTPFGLGYSSAEGLAKVDLNTADFNAVVNTIDTGLMNFGGRGGGLASADYVNNIAANIVDFIDADTTPTAGAGYRGVEPIPFLNERMTRFVLQGPPVQEGRSGWVIRIETTEYFEFWNLHSRTSPATTINFVFTNNQPLQYSGLTNFSISTNYSLAIPDMPPGSYFVTNSPTITNEFSVNSFASPSTTPAICILIGDTRTVQYALGVEGSTYDLGSGSHYSDKSLRANDLVYFSGSYPGLGSKRSITGQSDADFINSVGDPRATFYMTDGSQPRPQIQPSWANGNTSFGGRTLQSGMSTARLTKEVRMTNWGDGGHSGTAGSRGSGTTPPAARLYVTNEVDYAPAFANPNTSGRLDRITDLAGIFDPLQWGETGQSAWANEPGAWTNLTDAATANTAYAGGHSLRFGRPEFTRFTNNGTRAAQLLDLFAVSSATNSSSGTLLNTVAGRININTAGTNALRALAAGVFHTNDPRLASGSGAGTNFVVPKAAVDGFVTGVTNFRSARPFYSPSQLPLLSTNSDGSGWPGSAVFGNRALMGITAGNDAATEEWFSRVYPLATVRSRNFLVNVIGQALQTNGIGVISAERIAVQVYLQPMRDGAGLTTNSIPRVIQSWSL